MNYSAECAGRLERLVMPKFSVGGFEHGGTIFMDDRPLCASEILMRLNALESMHTARPAEEWHEDLGPVLWWFFPVQEEPYCGTPNDDDWPGDYLTHWSPIPIPVAA